MDPCLGAERIVPLERRHRALPPHPGPVDDHEDRDAVARFLIDDEATVVAMNAAARTMTGTGKMHLDGRGRLMLPRRHRSAIDPVRRALDGVATTRVYQLGTGRILALLIEPTGEQLRLRVSATEVALDQPIDLAPVVDGFGITECELPVLAGIADAICPKEVSRALCLSIHTVRSHLRSIYAKLGVRSSAEAQRMILRICLSVPSPNQHG